MSTVTALKQGLDAGKPLLSAWCGLPEPSVAGMLAQEDFDAVTLDMQHGVVDLAQTLRTLPLIAAAGKPMIARIPVGDFASASRLLDAGVSGVIAPMINTNRGRAGLRPGNEVPPHRRAQLGAARRGQSHGARPRRLFRKSQRILHCLRHGRNARIAGHRR